MESNSRFSQALATLGDRLNDQVWFQQLRGKWEELDTQSRFYLKIGSIVASTLLIFGVLLTSFLGVRSLKQELEDKSELVHLIQTANDELRRLKESNAGSDALSEDAAPWPQFFEQTAQSAGIQAESLTVSEEKPVAAPGGARASKAPAETGSAQEAQMDISLKKVNIKQLVRFAFQVENGARPVKVRNLTIDTQADASGYLDATLAVSTFSLKQ